MIKAYRYRIYPTKRQQAVLNAQLAICCELYNAALQERRDAWKYQHTSISYFDQTLQLTQIKPLREDVGINHFATLSDGSTIENPRWFRTAQAKLRRLQRRVARRKRGSNRRRKAALLLQRFHNHVRDQRRDFHHKASRKIVNQNGMIAVEDLNVKGLARGYLSKSVNDAGWSDFLFMLAYKAEEAGRVFVRVDPRGTSQSCTCGAEVRKTLKDRVHVCLSCGLVGDRDHIAAQIILGRAERLQALTSPAAECVA